MLFFNFLWLFYLMVLINCYTISKSGENEDPPSDVADSLREVEGPREFRPRGHRLLRAHDGDTPTSTTQANQQASKARLSSRLRNFAFWQKFRHRNKTLKKSKHRKRHRFEITTFAFTGYGDNDLDRMGKNKREVSTGFGDKDMENVFERDFFVHPKDFFAKTKNNQIKYFNLTSSLSPTLKSVTSSISSVKTTQSSERNTKRTSQSFLESKKTSSGAKASSKTTLEWVGTAQIEALLDNIKARAMQILVDQNPSVSSLVTTSVNEVSFDSDPILRHVEHTMPSSHSATIGVRNVNNNNTITDSTLEINSTVDASHNIIRRNPTEDIYTVAQTLEDVIQQEIKNAYNKLRCKMHQYHKPKLHITTTKKITKNTSPETSWFSPTTEKTTTTKAKKLTTHVATTSFTTSYRTSESHTAPTLHTAIPSYNKVASTITPTLQTKSTKILSRNPKENGRLGKLQHRVVKAARLGKKKNNNKATSTSVPTRTSAASTVDDVTLLGLLEQMLVKTNEDNMLRMLTTPYIFCPKSYLERLSKRNIETLSDMKLKEQVQSLKHSDLVPGLDYPVVNPQNEEPADNPQNEESTPSPTYLETVTIQPLNYESISEKISYNDYVNGYKYYLKFQKEQDLDDQKFSPLVRYQAHRHHKVDDIGKFILRKLPPVRLARNIFEEIDIDDQDISTKSDESWFKKHFYLFLDNTPRKFHTSEMVSLKSGQTESSMAVNQLPQFRIPTDGSMISVADHQGHVQQAGGAVTLPSGVHHRVINLDQLSRTLENYKNALSTSSMSPIVSNLMNQIDDKPVEPVDNSFIIKMIDILLRNKDRRAPKQMRKVKQDAIYQTESRLRRNVKKLGQHEEKLKSKTPLNPAGEPDASNKRKDKLSQMGVVQMIAQPTTVVKIQGKKKSRLKNMLKKLHLSGKGDKKKSKRQFRKRRFVPFKKIKEIFMGSQHENQASQLHKGVSDYDLMTSEIDTFKAVKFDRMPKIEEMKKEIPNIADDLLAPDMIKDYTTAKSHTSPMTSKSKEADITENIDSQALDNDPLLASNNIDVNNIDDITNFDDVKKASKIYKNNKMNKMTMSQLENYLSGFRESFKGSSTEMPLNSPDTNPQNMMDKSIIESLKGQKQNNLETKSGKPTEASSTDFSEIYFNSSSPSEKAMEFVRQEVDKLQNKLIIYDSFHGSASKKPEITTVSDRVTREKFASKHTQKYQHKIHSFNENKRNKVIRAVHDVKLPKFENIESVIEFPQIPEYPNYKFIKKKSVPFIHMRRDSGIAGKRTSPEEQQKFHTKKYRSKYSMSPDHYGELLMWHGDILNVDSVTTTTNYLYNDSLSLYTTPNVQQLADELQKIKSFIHEYSNSSTTRTTDHSTDTEQIFAKDHFVIGDNEVIELKRPIADKITEKKMSNFYPTEQRHPTTTSQQMDDDKDDNEIVFMGKAQYLSISKKGKLDLDSKSGFGKMSKSKFTAQPTLFYAKRMSSNANWTKLYPRPNVIYTTSSNRNTARLWKKHTANVQSSSKKVQSLSPTSKMNRAPKQYFSTPLPMNSRDFQDFLKQSNLDVDSVTAPIADVDVNIRSDKPNFSDMPAANELPTPKDMKSSSDDDIFINAFKQLKLSPKNLSQIATGTLKLTKNSHLKRYRLESGKINRIVRRDRNVNQRAIIFGKKETATVPVTKLLSEDIKKEDRDVTDYDNSVTEEQDPTTDEIHQDIKLAKHNNLLYYFVYGNSTTTGSTMSTTTMTTPVYETTGMELMRQQTPDKLLRRLDLKSKSPKRVRISYHYDIVYENKQNKNREKGPVKKANRFERGVHDSDSKVAATSTKIDMTTSDINDHYKHMQPRFRLVKKKRQARLNVTNEIKRKLKRHVDASLSTAEPALSKRNVNPVTYTAQNVGAFEVYLDVAPNTPTAPPVPYEKNAIQVHIALPHQQQNVKRHLNPSRPIFSAKMSDAVNLEYQVPVMDEKVMYATEAESYLSPGLYMVVDSMLQSGHITLKPVLSDLSVLKPRQVSPEVPLETATTKCSNTNNVDDLKKVTLNKDFISAVNKHLVQLYDNLTSSNNVKKNVSNVSNNTIDYRRSRRDIWPSLKEMFGGERTCSCHFKANQTLCPTCVATDAVMEELIFEFNNLANFMKDHCTEIQTFFWMNPTGGKKLSDSVHRLDRMLHDYYKRVRGKCQGKTCQALAGRLNKRAINDRRRILNEVGLLPQDVQVVTNDIANILKHRIPYNKRLTENGEYFFNAVESCLPGVRNIKSTFRYKHKRPTRSFHPQKLIKYKNKVKSRHHKLKRTEIEHDTKDGIWNDGENIDSTEKSSQEMKLTTDLALNAFTHKLNDFLLSFNKVNGTFSKPVNKLPNEGDEVNNKIGKKKKKKKQHKKKKKPNKTHKEIKNNATSIELTPNIESMILPTNVTTTRALRLIVANVKEKPALYVTVKTLKTPVAARVVPPAKVAPQVAPPVVAAVAPPVVASVAAPITPPPITPPNVKTLTICQPCQHCPTVQRIKITDQPTRLHTGETIIFEEGCADKNNFLHRIQNIFGTVPTNYTKNTLEENYIVTNKARMARTPNIEPKGVSIMPNTISASITAALENTTEATSIINSPAILFSNQTSPSNSQTSTNYSPTILNNSLTLNNIPTSPHSTESFSASDKLLSDINAMLESSNANSTTENVENVITVPTESVFPTIIIIDEASTETATDDVTVDVMPPFDNNYNTTDPNYDPKDLLLSILKFEKDKLDEELTKVRSSRDVNASVSYIEKNLMLISNKTSSKRQNSATGNYSIFSDLKDKISKTFQKSLKEAMKCSCAPCKNCSPSRAQPPCCLNKTKPLRIGGEKNKIELHVQVTTAPLNQTKSKQKKASDVHRVPVVCDLSATIDHVIDVQRKLNRRDFERFVRDLKCYEYRKIPRYFIIKKVSKTRANKNKMKLKWDWIRNEREIDANASKESRSGDGIKKRVLKDEGTISNVLVSFLIDDDFEKFYKGEHGIYKMEDSKRKRRTVDAPNLTKELTDLPPLRSAPNEILAMNEDPVVLHCSGLSRKHDVPSDRRVEWLTEPEGLLQKPNVKVEGNELYIDHVWRSNAGSYICKEGDRIHKRFQLSVLALPTFQIVLTPVYSILEETCTYDDLRKFCSLSSSMIQLICPRGHCSMHVHGPDCLRDMSDSSVLIRAIASLTVSVPAVACSVSCKRDLVSQLVRLAVEDIPKLVTVDVFMEGITNKTLIPIARDGQFAVTRRLRKRGFSRKREDYQPVPPGSVHVTVSCPRGFRLLPSFKICAADRPAPRKDKQERRPNARPTRRYDWWWYPPCGYCAACAAAAACCGACAACALLATLSKDDDDRGWAEATNRRVSPSRVIIARLFKRSLSAFRHTDSQETRSFPTKPVPPPLPPIDFD